MASAKSGEKASENYYEILGVSTKATDEEIKQAYRRLALKYHPDKNPSPEATAQFQKIKKAYEILSNPRARDAYDRFGSQAAEAMHQYNEYPTTMTKLTCCQKFLLGLFCCVTCCCCFGGCCCFCGFFCCCDCCCDHCCHHCCHPERSGQVHHDERTTNPDEDIFQSQPTSPTARY